MKAVTIAKPDADVPYKDNHERELYLKITVSNKDYLDAALACIKQSKGKSKLYVYYDERKSLTVSKDIFAEISEDLISELKEILGGENVAVKIKEVTNDSF
ncbi:hypothetical protein EOM82_09480 [bacterium]|nr:hypothetical protein [bacterium]